MSAESGQNVEVFRNVLIEEVKKVHKQIYPHYLEDEVFDLSRFDEDDGSEY